MNGFSKQATAVLKTRMCMDMDHLQAKIKSPEVRSFSNLIHQAIENFCGFVIGNESREKVNSHFSFITQDIDDDCEAYFVLDSVRMAFFTYISGGLHDLYTCQENESWYPKIELTELLEPNDIESLEETFVIYRGCDKSEQDLENVGQSWTASIKIAREFAFKHYVDQEWYAEGNRVVLKALSNRENVLFSNQTEYGEYEIVIRKGTINGVQIVT